MVDIWAFFGFGVMFLIALGLIALIGCGILIYIAVVIGGILTLIDHFAPKPKEAEEAK